MRSRHIAAAMLLAALVSACGGGDPETTQYSETVDEIVVTAAGGRVSVAGDSNASVTEVETSAAGVAMDLADGTLTIDDGCGGETDCKVDIAVTVPVTVNVTVTTLSGPIVINDTVGSVTAVTVSGAISLNGIEGNLDRVETESGSVLGARLEAASASVTSVSGDVDLTFDEPVDEVTVVTDGGNATVQVAGEPYQIITATTSGSIDVVVDEDPNAGRVLNLTTGSGDIKVYRK